MQGEKIILNNSDITVIIRKLQEFELFKKIILNQDQQTLFNQLPKPNLLDMVEKEEERTRIEKQAEKNKKSNLVFKEDASEDVKEEGRELQEVYDRINKDRKQSEISNKLLAAVEEEIVRQRDKRESNAHKSNEESNQTDRSVEEEHNINQRL